MNHFLYSVFDLDCGALWGYILWDWRFGLFLARYFKRLLLSNCTSFSRNTTWDKKMATIIAAWQIFLKGLIYTNLYIMSDSFASWLKCGPATMSFSICWLTPKANFIRISIYLLFPWERHTFHISTLKHLLIVNWKLPALWYSRISTLCPNRCSISPIPFYRHHTIAIFHFYLRMFMFRLFFCNDLKSYNCLILSFVFDFSKPWSNLVRNASFIPYTIARSISH